MLVFDLKVEIQAKLTRIGLPGLASNTAERRNREISIRKVPGADISTIVAMLFRHFLKLELISIFIAIPIGDW